MDMFSNEIVLSMLQYFDLNLYKKISMEELSSIFHYHKDYLMRIFKREIHCTIIDYLNQKRIYYSLDSLKYHDSVLNIALKYSFYSQEYYCEMFHKYLGVSPSTYRKFLNFDRNLSDSLIFNIQRHYFELVKFFKSVDNYQLNTPPKKNVLHYSIFS